VKNLIVASTSTLHGQSYLEYLLPELSDLYQNTEEIIFIPYARPGGITHEAYTALARKALETIGISVKGLHSFSDPKSAIKEAKGIFTGGGNTFVLVKALQDLDLMNVLSSSVVQGIPYLGTSAGSNICGLTMKNTNDMPIVYPKSFDTLGLLPFNINPHYLDPNPNSSHMGETRETRIKEFHAYNNTTVVGLREGSWLRVIGNSIELKGPYTARVFECNKEAYEVKPGSYLENLAAST
jgi:dipeptidase E